MRRAISIFARRGLTNPFGKMHNLGTLRLGHQTEERVRLEAAKLGLAPIEFVRLFIEQGLHGRAQVENAITVRLDTIDALLPKQHRKEPQD